MLKLIEYIKSNPNWESDIQKKPYCVEVKKEDGVILLKYNQIESDFLNEMVRECRGIILSDTFIPVCVPFFKFGNYGESYCPEIDWGSARVQEKIDGSLIKVWYYNGKWRVSTNGTIDAYKAEIKTLICENKYKTFGELFDEAKKNSNLDFDKLDESNTYMFELVSPYNKIIVPYSETKLYHIGTRNRWTFEEIDEDIGVEKPKEFDLHSIEDCIKATKLMPFSEEGYVVVDKNWNRIKIKSPAYVTAHHLKGNGELNFISLIELLRTNETEEFLTYFPEYKEIVDTYKSKIESIIYGLESYIRALSGTVFETQKDFALAVKDHPFASYFFLWRQKGTLPKDWFWSLTNNKIKEILTKNE